MVYVAELLSVSRMFWSGPFQVMVGFGRPQTLHCSITVSPSKQVTSTKGTRNSGATAIEWIHIHITHNRFIIVAILDVILSPPRDGHHDSNDPQPTTV